MNYTYQRKKYRSHIFTFFIAYDFQTHPTNNSHRQHFTTKYNITDNILQGILDHYMSFHISEKCSPDTEEYQLIRLVNDTRMTKYKERISDTDRSVLDVYDTCGSYFSSFINIFKSIFNDSFRIMKTKRNYRNCLSWLTVDLKESIRSKNKLHRISRKHPTSYNDNSYWEYI